MVRESILATLKTEKIKVYVVWTPVLREDERARVSEATQVIQDERSQHFWDEDKSLGLSFGKIVTLPRKRTLAWDVYFVFDEKAVWNDQPPAPANWMHQLSIDEKSLDGGKLLSSIKELLKREGESR